MGLIGGGHKEDLKLPDRALSPYLTVHNGVHPGDIFFKFIHGFSRLQTEEFAPVLFLRHRQCFVEGKGEVWKFPGLEVMGNFETMAGKDEKLVMRNGFPCVEGDFGRRLNYSQICDSL